MLPSTSLTKTDGNLGVSSNTDRILAIIGGSATGTANVATALTNKNDVVTQFGLLGSGGGPLVEAACYAIAAGIPVVLIKATTSVAATYGTITHTGVLGTATIVAGATNPQDDYDVVVIIQNGGTLGTAGITFIYSLDNGVSYSAAQSLGTSLTMTLDSGVSFTLATGGSGTFLAGDTFSVSTTAPRMNSTTDLTTAFTALTNYAGEWLRALVLIDADSTALGNCDTFAKSFHSQGKYPEVVTCTRGRHVSAAESVATFQTAMAAISAAVQSTEVMCCADACEMVSLVNGRRLRKPPSIPVVARLMTNDDSQDAAAKADGALSGIFLTTAAGLQNYTDERLTPGLDANYFTTLRTWGGRPITPGAYVNNPRLLAGGASDYQFFQLSAIENRIIERAFQQLNNKLSASAIVDPTTGFIKEDVARGIEQTITQDLRTQYKDPARVSDVKFTLSRTDNILVTNTLTFQINTVPLGYVKFFTGKSGLVRTLPN